MDYHKLSDRARRYLSEVAFYDTPKAKQMRHWTGWNKCDKTAAMLKRTGWLELRGGYWRLTPEARQAFFGKTAQRTSGAGGE